MDRGKRILAAIQRVLLSDRFAIVINRFWPSPSQSIQAGEHQQRE
jgi:hypothetical protein